MSSATTRHTVAVTRAGWARERLWLGMSNVGLWVVVALALLVVGPPQLGLGWGDAAVLLAAYLLVQAPFDFIGGWWLQQRHQRGARPFGSFLASWSRGVFVHGALLTMAGAGAIVLYSLGGALAVWIAGAAGMLVLMGLQRTLLLVMTGVRSHPVPRRIRKIAMRARLNPDRVRIVDADDPSFVGAWVGLPGTELLLIPQSWTSTLTEAQLLAQLRRRALTRKTGQRLRGVLVALAWNLAGSGIALYLYGVGDPAALAGTLAVFTLWSFLGVLVLPTLSRRGVYAVDHATVQAGIPLEHMRGALTRLDAQQDDEPERSDLVELIFHPVPALHRRMDALCRPVSGLSNSAWNAARTTLFLGGALMSPLSRAVHCNIGRPELWAVYPGD